MRQLFRALISGGGAPGEWGEVAGGPLSAREQREREGGAREARLSARYAAVLETAGRIWEMRQAATRREEIQAIVEELLEHADEDLRAYARRRHENGGRWRGWRWR